MEKLFVEKGERWLEGGRGKSVVGGEGMVKVEFGEVR